MNKIEEAAKAFCNFTDTEEGEAWSNDYTELAFKLAEFAKSETVKEYWIEQFKQNNKLFIALKLMGMYSEDEVKSLLIQNTNIYLDYIKGILEGKNVEKPDLLKWFDEIKKK